MVNPTPTAATAVPQPQSQKPKNNLSIPGDATPGSQQPQALKKATSKSFTSLNELPFTFPKIIADEQAFDLDNLSPAEAFNRLQRNIAQQQQSQPLIQSMQAAGQQKFEAFVSLYLSAYAWGRERKYTPAQNTVVLAILHWVLVELQKSENLESLIKQFKRVFLRSMIDTQHFPSPADQMAIIDLIMQTVFQHYRLLKLNMTKQSKNNKEAENKD